jgi:hypothetical protein
LGISVQGDIMARDYGYMLDLYLDCKDREPGERLSILRFESAPRITNIILANQQIELLGWKTHPLYTQEVDEIVTLLARVGGLFHELIGSIKPDADGRAIKGEAALSLLDAFWQNAPRLLELQRRITSSEALYAWVSAAGGEDSTLIGYVERSVLQIYEAIDVLAQKGLPDIPPEYITLGELLRAMRGRAALQNADDLTVLLAAAAHEQAFFRGEAVTLLRHFHDARAVDMLLRLQSDPDRTVAARAKAAV